MIIWAADPVPAIIEKIGTSFRRAVTAFAEDEHVPVVRFAKGDRNIDVMRAFNLTRAAGFLTSGFHARATTGTSC